MKIGKEVIYEYCKEKSKFDIGHIENCRDIKYYLEKGKLDKLDGECGCPSSFGLDDFTGDCEITSLSRDASYHDHRLQCQRCWDKALNCSC